MLVSPFRVDDSQWPEVKLINSYAGLWVCLRLLVRGLSFLVVTWTTVVLLGGFVSILPKEDFWSLTVITLIEIVWLGDATTEDKERAAGYSASAWKPVGRAFIGDSLDAIGTGVSLGRFAALSVIILPRLVALAVHVLVHTIVLAFFSLVLFNFGLLFTTGLSLWRLIQHSYDKVDGDPSEANMSPALRVLYTLVVAQGVAFLYTAILFRMGGKIAADVAKEYDFEGEDVILVSGYLAEALNADIAEGSNLVTYAVSMMGCDKYPAEHGFGMRILGALLWTSSRAPSNKFDGQRMMIRLLIGGSSPSSQTLQEALLQMLNYSRCDARTRECAARIVAHVADTIHLEKFPRGIQCISSLLETFEEYHHRALCLNPDPNYSAVPEEEDYRAVLLQGLHIIWVLAADQNNCRFIGEARGLLPKIMAPLTSDLLHQVGGRGAWLDVVEGSLKVMSRLTAAPGEAGSMLRRDISINKEAIGAMISILKSRDCDGMLIPTLEILTRLELDPESKQDFIEMLVDTFTGSESDGTSESDGADSARASAGKALAILSSQGGSNATIILTANGDTVDRLAAQLVHFTGDDSACLESAAEILENLCIHYTRPDEDEHLKKLKQAMTNVVMPKLLRDILLGEGARRRGTEADTTGFSSPLGDIEDQQDNVHNSNSSSSNETQQQRQRRKLHAALLSLCVTVWNTFISGDQDLSLHFDAFSLLKKLKEIVARNSDPTASCLTLIKVTSRMVIAIMKHRGSYPKQDLQDLVGALCRASKRMILVDGSTVFSSGDKSTTKDVRSLASLVQEASEIVRLYEAEELQVMSPMSVGGPS
ncbi:unnamed protein product [Alopecurus aequalis]